ncbi:hypothetical protein AVEN_54613-1 [Araneus ventricosus]|uniref:Uncharacterized protein n=1 Tax=Araneus ventricosus TaxID=182803 RepID=A0A4Y2BLM3_ARAVE|nr:hypothetical protein AVEN_54613-1 [Araneus ventricosus]
MSITMQEDDTITQHARRLRQMASRWTCDYFLLPELKEHLSGTRFSSDFSMGREHLSGTGLMGREHLSGTGLMGREAELNKLVLRSDRYLNRFATETFLCGLFPENRYVTSSCIQISKVPSEPRVSPTSRSSPHFLVLKTEESINFFGSTNSFIHCFGNFHWPSHGRGHPNSRPFPSTLEYYKRRHNYYYQRWQTKVQGAHVHRNSRRSKQTGGRSPRADSRCIRLANMTFTHLCLKTQQSLGLTLQST